jgi:predicted Zn finger-like uncharacterized protein
MRLICPSCETEYEVHDNMIPAEGRDVQCSSCMKTWFQSGPTNAELEVADDLKLDDSTSSDPQPKPATAPESSDYDEEYGDEDLTSLPPAAFAAERKSPKLGSEAMGIIREEVGREQSARKSEADPIETQIDLGIDGANSKDQTKPVPSTADEFDKELQAALADDETITPETPAKSDRLPDIEEINSTLADSPDYDDAEDDLDVPLTSGQRKTRSRRGFRLGFGLVLLFAAALVGIYVYASAISNSLPATAGFLEGYASTIDSIRIWLDRATQDMADQITKLLGTVS